MDLNFICLVSGRLFRRSIDIPIFLSLFLLLAAAQSSVAGDSSFSNDSYRATVKRLQSALDTAKGVLSDTEYSYFQSKLAGLKNTAEIQIAGGYDLDALSDPLKSFESELSVNVEQAKQNNRLNKDKLDKSLSHLHAVLSNLRPSLSKHDQEMFSDSVADLDARAKTIVSSVDTAERMSRLADEAGLLESTITGRSMLNAVTSSAPAADPSSLFPTPKSSVAETSINLHVGHGGGKAVPSPAPVFVEPKAAQSISQLFDAIQKQVADFASRGAIGSIDEDAFNRRLEKIQRNINAMRSNTGQLSSHQETQIRDDLSQLKADLAEHVAGRYF